MPTNEYSGHIIKHTHTYNQTYTHTCIYIYINTTLETVCFPLRKFQYSPPPFSKMITYDYHVGKHPAYDSVMSGVLPAAQELEEFWSHEKETAWYRAHPIFKAHTGCVYCYCFPLLW